jgi:hypothetical protein
MNWYYLQLQDIAAQRQHALAREMANDRLVASLPRTKTISTAESTSISTKRTPRLWASWRRPHFARAS